MMVGLQVLYEIPLSSSIAPKAQPGWDRTGAWCTSMKCQCIQCQVCVSLFSLKCTLPETNIAPENGWSEYDCFL